MKKILSEKKIFLIALIIIFILNFFKKIIPEYVNSLYVLIFIITLFGIMFTLKHNSQNIKHIFKIKSKKAKKILLLIIIFAVILRIIFPLVHTLLPDDFWLMEQGKNIVLKGQPINCIYKADLSEDCFSFKSVGYPTLISFIILIFGLNNLAILIFNSILSVINIYLIFILTLKIFKSKNIALWSAFIISLSHVFVITSNHVDNIIPAISFMLLSAIFLYSYKEELKNNSLALLFFVLMILTRFEYFLLLLFPTLIYLKNIFKNNNEKIRSLYSLLIIGLIIFISLFSIQFTSSINMHINQDRNDLLNENLFLFEEVKHTLNNFYFFQNTFNFLIYSLILIIGLIISFKNKNNMLFLISSIPLIYFYLSFPSPHFKETFLIILIILNLYVALGIDFIQKKIKNKKIIVFIIILLIFFSTQDIIKEKINLENNDLLMFNTEIFKEIKNINISSDCFVITERPPYIVSLKNLKGIRTLDIYEDEELKTTVLNNCVLFFQNEFCYSKRGNIVSTNTDEIFKDSISRCQQIKNTFQLEDIFSLDKNNRIYKLSKLNLK